MRPIDMRIQHNPKYHSRANDSEGDIQHLQEYIIIEANICSGAASGCDGQHDAKIIQLQEAAGDVVGVDVATVEKRL